MKPRDVDVPTKTALLNSLLPMLQLLGMKAVPEDATVDEMKQRQLELEQELSTTTRRLIATETRLDELASATTEACDKTGIPIPWLPRGCHVERLASELVVERELRNDACRKASALELELRHQQQQNAEWREASLTLCRRLNQPHGVNGTPSDLNDITAETLAHARIEAEAEAAQLRQELATATAAIKLAKAALSPPQNHDSVKVPILMCACAGCQAARAQQEARDDR